MAWESTVYAGLADATEVTVVVPAPDRAPVRVPIWIVATGGELFVRSWKGDDGLWYRRARRHGTGSVVLGGVEHRIRFVPVGDPAVEAEVDGQFLSKYRQSPYAVAMTRPPAAGTTLRVAPA